MTTREEAAEVVETIAGRFANPEATMMVQEGASLGSGYPGLALLYCELSHDDYRYRSAAHAWLTKAAQSGDVRDNRGLFYGAPALSFAVHRAVWQPSDYADALARIDDKVARLTQARIDALVGSATPHGGYIPSAAYDVISGLAGLGGHLLYAAPSRDDLLRPVLESLAEMALSFGAEPWRTRSSGALAPPTSSAPPGVRERRVQLGMAHGIAGPLALLALAREQGKRTSGMDAAIHTLAGWLLDRRLPDAAGRFWPAEVGKDGHLLPPRHSWCHGTPGVARSLYLAGRALSVSEWQNQALTAFKSVIADPLPNPRSAGLCHGWAGLLYSAWLTAFDTSDKELKDALPAIAARVLEAVDSTDSYEPGTAAHGADADNDDRIGFVEGAAGIALALHAFATDSPPVSRWDRALMLA
ncbi:lanthionine synthetase C family protein [Streptomyces sp. NPDC002159]